MLNWHDLDDNQLINLSKDGESEAFGELYERHVTAVYRFLYARLDNRMDAEDFTEEVFMRAWHSLSTYNERGIPFLAFLLIVARNVLIDHYRQRKPEVGFSVPEPALESIRPLDEHMIRDEQLQDLRRAMDEIPLNYREVIILRIIMAMPTATVANWMNLTEGATRVLLHRALAALRGRLQEQA